MAWLVRIHISEEWAEMEPGVFERLTQDVHKRWPELLNESKELSRVETKRYMRERGFKSPYTSRDGELYVIELPEKTMEAMERYGHKIARALHYKVTGKIVPGNAYVFVKGFTNGAILSDKFPTEALSILQQKVEIQRCKTPLRNQFDYVYAIVEDGEASSFFVGFRESCALHLTVFCDRERYDARHIQIAQADASSAEAELAPTARS